MVGMRPSLMHALSALNAQIYRLSGGRVMGRLPSGAPVCLLTTKGRKSGRRRTVPLLYLKDGADLVIVGSQGGAPGHPAWYFNLQADPKGEVQVGHQRMAVVARETDRDDRDRLWPRLVAIYPPYEEYQRRTARLIPLMRLSPAAGSATV